MVTSTQNRDQEEKSICEWRDGGSNLSDIMVNCVSVALRREIWARVSSHCGGWATALVELSQKKGL